MESTVSNCKNCNTPLTGEYCHQCGQQDKQSIRSVFAVVGDLFGELGHWDSRFYRTLRGLFLKPGFLSSEFMKGRHAFYVPPLRLYFFISLISFMVLTSQVTFNDSQSKSEARQSETEVSESDSNESTVRRGFELEFGDIPWLNEEQTRMFEQKLQHLKQNPQLFTQKLISMTPQMMLLMLPFWALYLKVLYLFSNRYYLEHLTVALHTHAFLLLSLMLLSTLGYITNPLIDNFGWTWLTLPSDWLGYILIGWMFTYLLLTQKSFYQQSWTLTVFKFLACVFGYFLLLSASFVLMVIIGILNA